MTASPVTPLGRALRWTSVFVLSIWSFISLIVGFITLFYSVESMLQTFDLETYALLTGPYALYVGSSGYARQILDDLNVPEDESAPPHLIWKHRFAQAVFGYGVTHVILIIIGYGFAMRGLNDTWYVYFGWTSLVTFVLCVLYVFGSVADDHSNSR